MKKYLIILVLCLGVVGCTADEWGKFEQGADKVAGGSDKAAEVNGALSPITGPYGIAVGGILVGIGGIARALSNLAKAKKLAKAAVAAAEMVEKGGSAISTAAVLHGAQDEITAAYETALKTGLIAKKD